MNGLSSFTNRYAVAIFSALTIPLSFAAYLLPLPREALPFVLVCIPAIVAILLAAVAGGRSGVGSLLRQLTLRRISFKWVMVAIAAAAGMRLAVSGIALLVGWIPSIQLRLVSTGEILLLAVIFIIAAVLEELGWRGFVLPRLLQDHSPLFSSLVIGVLWGVVHLALHLPGMPSDGLPGIPTMFQMTGLSVLLTWFYIRGGRSILLTSLFHAAQSFFVLLNGGVTLEQQLWLMAIVWPAAGAITLLASRSRQLPASSVPV